MNTMKQRDCAGLIAPCRVQLLSLNQPCAAISGVRRAKRLQPAISFRLSAAIKHPSPICNHSGGHTSARARMRGNRFRKQRCMASPGGDVGRASSPRPSTKTSTVILSHAAAGSVVQMFAGKCGSRPPEYMSRGNDVVCNSISLQLLLSYHCSNCAMRRLHSTLHFCFIRKIVMEYFLKN